jgi:hypothetical protein
MVFRKYDFACHYSRPMSRFLDHDIRKIHVSCYINPFFRDKCGAILVCMVLNEKGEPFIYKAVSADKPGSKRGVWTEVRADIDIPDWLNDPGYRFACYLWNDRKKSFLVDDFEVRFE